MAEHQAESADAQPVTGDRGRQGPVRPARPSAPRWEGLSGDDLAHRLHLPRVVVHSAIRSTMDVAHALAVEGTPPGTLVIADQQTAGRGRSGHRWVSPPGSGVWMTLIERPADAAAVELWGVRLGVHVAQALDPHAGQRVGIKWPNDLYLADRKLAGILVEARWQEQALLWVGVGIGINVRQPGTVRTSVGLETGADRLTVLESVVHALRAATGLGAVLGKDELRECRTRDVARGRVCREPAAGRVLGIGPRGELRVRTGSGVQTFRSGSLVLDQNTEVA